MLDQVIAAIERERSATSHAAASKGPGDERNLFEYGFGCGKYAGLARAIELIQGLLDADRRADADR